MRGWIARSNQLHSIWHNHLVVIINGLMVSSDHCFTLVLKLPDKLDVRREETEDCTHAGMGFAVGLLIELCIICVS